MYIRIEFLFFWHGGVVQKIYVALGCDSFKIQTHPCIQVERLYYYRLRIIITIFRNSSRSQYNRGCLTFRDIHQ